MIILINYLLNTQYHNMDPPWQPGFYPRSGHVGFVVDKVALGQVSPDYFSFPCWFSFHELLYIH
jgi:Zn-dependent M28 family amino/carboxypeptidase